MPTNSRATKAKRLGMDLIQPIEVHPRGYLCPSPNRPTACSAPSRGHIPSAKRKLRQKPEPPMPREAPERKTKEIAIPGGNHRERWVRCNAVHDLLVGLDRANEPPRVALPDEHSGSGGTGVGGVPSVRDENDTNSSRSGYLSSATLGIQVCCAGLLGCFSLKWTKVDGKAGRKYIAQSASKRHGSTRLQETLPKPRGDPSGIHQSRPTASYSP